MINPLKRNFVKGFLWYQGETNGGYGGYLGFNRDYYQCTFPAMIDSWRHEFSLHSMTDETAPFGFVQLASWRPDTVEASFPVIRWHQTADHGFVPNEEMKNVFMAVSLDTYDDKEDYPGNLHPRYKQIVAERLAVAGLSIAYGLNYPTNGPFPLSIEIGGGKITVTYDKDLTYIANEISGFYYCTQLDDCDAGIFLDLWTEIEMERVEQVSTTEIVVQLEENTPFWLSYLWRETPVLAYRGLPVYEAAETSLPSPPWKWLVEGIFFCVQVFLHYAIYYLSKLTCSFDIQLINKYHDKNKRCFHLSVAGHMQTHDLILRGWNLEFNYCGFNLLYIL